MRKILGPRVVKVLMNLVKQPNSHYFSTGQMAVVIKDGFKLTTSAVEALMLEQLPQERDDTLCAVLVHIRQVDLVAEQH